MMAKPKKHCECGSYEHTRPMAVGGKVVWVDFCVAQLVAALEAAGMNPVASCCGHGERPASVALADGTEVVVLSPADASLVCRKYGAACRKEEA